MADSRKIALYDPEKHTNPLIMVPTSLLHPEDYDLLKIPTLHSQFDVYGPTRLDDPDATWKIVWTGEEDFREHMPFARISYTKGLGWWDGSLKRIVSERGREMLIGPMPPALPLLEHAGIGMRGLVRNFFGRLITKGGRIDGNVLLVVPIEENAPEKLVEKLPSDFKRLNWSDLSTQKPKNQTEL